MLEPGFPDSCVTADFEKISLSANASSSEPVFLMSPVLPCAFSFHGIDSNTGRVRKDVAPNTLFSYTERSLEQHFRNRDFVVGTGFLTAIEGGWRILQLELTVSSPQALELYGTFRQGDFLEISLLNGQVIRLFNRLENNGIWKPELQGVVYRGQYTLSGKEEKMLRKSEIDQMKIRWSKVEQSFEVYELDFFIRQFECLESL